MPVYSETLDDPRGMVHIRDVLAHITKLARVKKGRTTRKTPASPRNSISPRSTSPRTIGELNLIRPVLFVPPSMLASDLMGRMQTTRTQMALVIDEYGGTDGLVSLEDIVEMVVGDIEDEHDDDEPMITQAGDGVFVVDGKAEIDDVAKMIGEDFAAGEHGEYVDTIGGMIFNTLGRVPARGEVVQAIPGFEFHVLDADPRRVKRVRIVQSQKARAPPARHGAHRAGLSFRSPDDDRRPVQARNSGFRRLLQGSSGRAGVARSGFRLRAQHGGQRCRPESSSIPRCGSATATIIVDSEWADHVASPASVSGKNTQSVYVRLKDGLDAHCEQAQGGGRRHHPGAGGPVLRRTPVPGPRSRRPCLDLQPAHPFRFARRGRAAERPADRGLAPIARRLRTCGDKPAFGARAAA